MNQKMFKLVGKLEKHLKIVNSNVESKHTKVLNSKYRKCVCKTFKFKENEKHSLPIKNQGSEVHISKMGNIKHG